MKDYNLNELKQENRQLKILLLILLILGVLILWNSFYQKDLINLYYNVISSYQEKNCFSDRNCGIEKLKGYEEDSLVCRTPAILV